MGVPKFYRWLSERYPQINQVITDSALLPEFDHLYLDMNGIIHGCTHPPHLDVSEQLTERDMFLGIMHYLDRIVTQIVKPKVSVYMAIDGVAPRAKLNQQRSRRFRSAKDMAEAAANADKLGRLLAGTSEEKKSSGSQFDSNCITPGTEFLNRVSEAIEYFIRKKMKEDPVWQKLKVYYSGPNVPGEGEHKIMEHIRHMKASPDYKPNTRHCMYGSDADLIMLGLVTHEPHFTLLREVIDFNRFQKKGVNTGVVKTVMKFTKQSDFQLLHLSILREYLEIEFCNRKDKASYNLEAIVDDFVFLTFLVGNDFLPHMPSLDIGDGAFDLLFNTYKEQRQGWGSGQHLTSSGKISNAARLEAFLKVIGEAETEIFEKREENEAIYNKKRRKWDKRDNKTSSIPSDEELAQIEGEREAEFQAAMHQLGFKDKTAISGSNRPTKGKKDFKGRYYYEKLKLLPTHNDEHLALRKSYIEGLIWCLAYYYEGCISWGWFYPYHYGPMLSDLTNLSVVFNEINFELGGPLKPFEQLMGCLPPASSALVPTPYRKLMCDQQSPIIEFYPKEFEVDMNGKKNPWEGVNLLPFIDVNLLKSSILKLCPDDLLSLAEKSRNTVKNVQLFKFDLTCNDTVPSFFRDIGLLDITHCHSRKTTVQIPENTVPFKPELLPGTQIPFPGFPSLNVLPIASVDLSPIGLNCFGMASKYSTMVLRLMDLPDMPAISQLAPQVLGSTVFVNWPMMHEARVIALSDAKGEICKEGYRKFSSMERERWEESTEAIYKHYFIGQGIPGSGGLNINQIQIRLKVAPLQGMKQFPDGSAKKVFGKEVADIPLHMALFNAPAPDPRFVENGPKKVGDLYPKGSRFLVKAGKYKGCEGKVVGVYETSKSILASVSVSPPEAPFGAAIARAVKDSYMSSAEAASILKINPVVLGKITGSLVVNPGKYDLGLNLKYKRQYYVLGYTRLKEDSKEKKDSVWTEGDTLKIVGSKTENNGDNGDRDDSRVSWEYTPKAVRLVACYQKQYPQLFAALSKFPQEKTYDAQKLFGKAGAESLPKIRSWLDTVETAKLPRVTPTTQSLPKSAVLAIQRASAVVGAALEQRNQVKTINLKLNPSLVYREASTAPTDVIKSQDGPPELGDRVANLCAEGIPFGSRGVVVGIHNKTGCVEVVMDQEFIGGTSLQGTCEAFRGKLCPWAHLLKLSAGDQKVAETSGGNDFFGLAKKSATLHAEPVPAVKKVLPPTPRAQSASNRANTPGKGMWKEYKEAEGPVENSIGFKQKHFKNRRSGFETWKKLSYRQSEGGNLLNANENKIRSSQDLKKYMRSKVANSLKASTENKISSSQDLKKAVGVGTSGAEEKSQDLKKLLGVGVANAAIVHTSSSSSSNGKSQDLKNLLGVGDATTEQLAVNNNTVSKGQSESKTSSKSVSEAAAGLKSLLGVGSNTLENRTENNQATTSTAGILASLMSNASSETTVSVRPALNFEYINEDGQQQSVFNAATPLPSTTNAPPPTAQKKVQKATRPGMLVPAIVVSTKK